ncbi:RNA polymerase factor sigma-54 [Thermodesulfovibrio yellowstonii]|uniref:RNA polymerase sigma-54 factor n=2 Tax=Thermodesulfovibrio yellowstonii TaxID=28262 RepID=B5YI16_THEYD|nr:MULTISPECIES: RNA polymerase factor sigma-54 [Thermodesulfovibrio]ACI21859.1 RNA polymerase sigma-54 factor [Thermodesulfovibrio yellowstonii DSM 11347]MDI6864695.1 RNA polymerase factor sigma-54 [Thermodesulfovibrio yellowstonii]GLI54419.1 RNA polymerase sigma-54 factor [Thermodesulfovibrio islandicus]
MGLEQRTDLRLTQKLALTPQLQLQLKLLQLPQLELSQYIQLELMENPILELDEETENIQENEVSSEEYEEPVAVDKLEKIMIDEYFAERADDGRDLGYFNPGVEEKPSFELFYSTTTDLWEHLLWQLRLSKAPDKIRAVAEVVIGNIDEDGYLKATEEEIAKMSDTDNETVKQAIALVQEFDPAGVAARDIKECLILQIKALGLGDTLVQSFIEEHLEDIKKKKYENIAKRFGISIDEVIKSVKIIEKLEPRPGRNFSKTQVNIPVPDVYVTKVEGEYQIILNDEGIPKLRLSKIYRELFTEKNLPVQEKKYLREKFKNAVELLRSIEQRNKTIYRVTESLVKFQKEFFDKGVSYVKPLNLKDIAQDLGLHESTISRVTSNKYLACEHGLFNFRFFFSNALSSNHGGISTTLVKDLIQKIINEENHTNPLSDKEISDMLKKQGIDIARRTVAKYREELKIPPKPLRKLKNY